MYNTQANSLISTIIITCTLVSYSAVACDLDKLNRGEAGHGCTPDTGPGITSPRINPGTSYRTLIELRHSTHPGLTNPQRPSRPGDAVPGNSDTRINRFGPPIPSRPSLARRIYLTDGWQTKHGNTSFPLNVKSLAKYNEFKLHLENRDKGHECYFATTNTSGGCLNCNADWTPANYLVAGPMRCGVNDTGWRPAVEGTGTVPDGKACPRAFYTSACGPRPQHTPPTLDTGRTCNPERNRLNSAINNLGQCQADQANDPTVDCTGEDAAVTTAQQDLDQCRNLPDCQWDYNEGPWSPWKPSRAGECQNHAFIQTSVRTLNPRIIGSPNSCRHTSPSLPSHQRQQTVTGTRPATDLDCGGGPGVAACTTWDTTPWTPSTDDAILASQTCTGDTAEKTRTVTPGPAPCTGTPSSTRPATKKIIQGTMNCTPTNPVNGICDNNGFGLCVDGNPINLNSIANTWNCEGQNGGTDSLQCRYNPVPIDGRCDNSAFGRCTAGDPILLNTNNNTWSCQGRNGGSTDITCHFQPVTMEDGECDNTRFGECLAGTAIYLNSINFTWTCDGQAGGTADLCAALPINGQCDNDNLGQCLAGNPTTVTGINWNCEGLFGGLDAPKCEFTGVDPDPTTPPPTDVTSCFGIAKNTCESHDGNWIGGRCCELIDDILPVDKTCDARQSSEEAWCRSLPTGEWITTFAREGSLYPSRRYNICCR